MQVAELPDEDQAILWGLYVEEHPAEWAWVWPSERHHELWLQGMICHDGRGRICPTAAGLRAIGVDVGPRLVAARARGLCADCGEIDVHAFGCPQAPA